MPGGNWQTASLPVSAQVQNLSAQSSGDAVGTTAIIGAPAAAKALHQLLLDPWSDNQLARWPDQYTMVPTFIAKDVAHFPMTIFNGGTATSPTSDGAAALYFRGDPTYTYRQVSSIASSTASPAYDMDWNSAMTNMRSSMPTGAMARPVGTGIKFTFSGVGVFHTIVARVIELPPYFAQIGASKPTNFPSAANDGPTFAQREYMRAREIVMQPGDTLNLVSLPGSRNGLNFVYNTSQRDDEAWSLVGASWSGFVVWFWGLYASDTLYADAVIHHEYVIPSPVTMPTAGAATRAITRGDTNEVQKVENRVLDVVSSGMNVFKTVVEIISGIASMAAPFLAPKNDMKPMHVQRVPPLLETALPPLMYSAADLLTSVGPPRFCVVNNRSHALTAPRPLPEEEKKEDDFHSVEQPDARPMSTPITSRDSSSSSSAPKVPPSGGRRQ